MISVAVLFTALIHILRLVSGSVLDYASEYAIDLEDPSIQGTLENARFSFIYFYSEGCKYCKEFEPVFEYVSILYNDRNRTKGRDFQVLKVNARTNQKLSQLFGITRYPTLKLLNYETKEIIDYNRRDRRLEYIVSFLSEEVPFVSPNFDNYISPVTLLDNDNFEDFVSNGEKGSIVVFTAPYSDGWRDYTFPSHFIQRLALANMDDLKFGLFDMDRAENLTMLERYMVRNIPSAAYFDGSGRVKVFETCKSEIDIPGGLGEKHLVRFVENLHTHTEGYGKWLDGIQDLHSYCSFTDMKDGREGVVNYGFNLKSSETLDDDLTLDEEFEMLLGGIEV